MALETEGLDRENGMDDKGPEYSSNGQLRPEKEEEDEEEEDEEPRLKYAILTKSLKPVYRNGDSTSTFLVAGDKMVKRAVSHYMTSIANVLRLLELTMETS